MIGSFQLIRAQPIAHAMLVLATVSVVGLALGSLKYRGIALGTAGVLFAGILFGHFGEKIDHAILDFVKEFGLVLFVFTIGLQLGPGFIAALRQRGWKLNALAAAVVAGGALVAVGCAKVLGVDFAAAVGVFSGATTNTPSLGAAQQAIGTLPGLPAERAALPALAYAVAYPVGVVGIIGSLLALRSFYGIDAAEEAEQFRAEQQRGVEPLERMNLVVENRGLEGQPLGSVPGRRETGVAVSVIRKAGEADVHTVTDATALHVGDVLLAVGTRHGLEQFARVVGRATDTDLVQSPGKLIPSRVVVTRREVLGRRVTELGIEQRHGVAVTRVSRGELEMTPGPELRLRFGDVLQLVGEPDGIARAARELGNSVKALDHTQFIPLFLGIALGVLVGIIPISLPGLPVPVRLGLAGGPLIVGIVVSRLGNVGRLVWHVPHSANLAFKELGITLFLAAVGLKAGEAFFATAFSQVGMRWLFCAALTATVPLLLVGVFARSVLKLNYTTISGMIAGSTTDPPALAFAGLLAKSEGPYVAYATVYPLTMLLRILAAQTLALVLCR